MQNFTTYDESMWYEWKEVTACISFGLSDTTAKQVKHKGKIYKARWWKNAATDKEPGTSESYNTGWEQVGIISNGIVTLNQGVSPNPYKLATPPGETPDGTYSNIDAGKGRPWGRQVFSPYIDGGLWYSAGSYMGLYPIAIEADKSKVQYINIGFIITDADGEAAFAGHYKVDGTGTFGDITAGFANQIKEFREKGGDVMISFGGEGGIPIHTSYRSAEALADKYMEIVENYDLKAIDFDIEGAHVLDKPSWIRNNEAILIMQNKMGKNAPDIWYTFPVLPSGLVGENTGNNAYYILKDAVERGIKVRGVNIMTMCFGSAFVPAPTDRYYVPVLEAAESLFQQIKTIYQKAGRPLTDQEAYSKVGITPWIGRSSMANETFTQSDARALLKYAQEKKVGMLAFWSLNRDQNLREDLKNTGIPQTEYEFSHILNDFNSID